MAMTIVESSAVIGGVDTHLDAHVAAALDGIGGLLGVGQFPATLPGYQQLLGWLGGFGTIDRVGVEGTGSYGAGLARHLQAAGVRVVEVDRADRQARRRQGKSDPADAISAARAAQSGAARGAPKGRDGAVEAIRTLLAAKRSARSERTATINRYERWWQPRPKTCEPASSTTPLWRWSPKPPRCVPDRATSSATPPASRCVSWAGEPAGSKTRSAASTRC